MRESLMDLLCRLLPIRDPKLCFDDLNEHEHQLLFIKRVNVIATTDDNHDLRPYYNKSCVDNIGGGGSSTI